jgi:hypothetical protein
MRIAKNPGRTSSVPEYREPEPLWLIPGKGIGKTCRPSRFLPVRQPTAPGALIKKPQHCQALDQLRRLGTAFA